MLLAFGELMMRVAPPGHLRFRQAMPGTVEVSFAGAEANVCTALALLGSPARFVTALPRSPLAEAAVASLRALGVDTGSIVYRSEGRLGVYYVETGANQRGSNVVYDRDHSAIALAQPEEYRFDEALVDVQRVHLTGITPSLSEAAFRASLLLAQKAKARGAQVSCDLNFRKKLWRWRPGTEPRTLARECMSQLLGLVDLLIANEEDAADVLDIHAAGTHVEAGQIDAAAYADVAREIVARFANIRHVAITLRESLSADHNNWGAMLYDAQAKRPCFAPLDEQQQYRPYEIRDIVDRVGGGDAFGAGLLYALDDPQLSDPKLAEPGRALAFAVAASCLKHSIRGDFNYVSRDEILALVGGAASGRVRR